MNYWDTDGLVAKIKNDIVSERDKKNYYLATTILTTLSMYLAISEGGKNDTYVLAEAITMTIIVIFGININYAANKGDKGKDYIQRVVMLSLPIMVRLLVLFVAISVLIFVAAFLTEEAEVILSYTVSIVMAIVLQLIYFWRINFHLKKINT